MKGKTYGILSYSCSYTSNFRKTFQGRIKKRTNENI